MSYCMDWGVVDPSTLNFILRNIGAIAPLVFWEFYLFSRKLNKKCQKSGHFKCFATPSLSSWIFPFVFKTYQKYSNLNPWVYTFKVEARLSIQTNFVVLCKKKKTRRKMDTKLPVLVGGWVCFPPTPVLVLVASVPSASNPSNFSGKCFLTV